MKPVIRVLGRWQPSDPNYNIVKREFVQWMQRFCPALQHCEVREPNRLDWNSFAYHHDNNPLGVSPPAYLLIVWSNVKPTELVYRNRSVLVNVPAGSVIAIQNDKVQHRTPPSVTLQDHRWFARCYIQKGDLSRLCAPIPFSK